ncbi:DENN domain-containing protein 1C isoform X4 [Choloepus didactylus]|uniref:DENN domain-containing protein 1C isoform X4 n=1 Tax=Choloepus didactylus TaxID=27675 RepID=UPI00189EAD6E|nr:DENN domain-containing protein 1C isoform X4 [Choloepus didactylus]
MSTLQAGSLWWSYNTRPGRADQGTEELKEGEALGADCESLAAPAWGLRNQGPSVLAETRHGPARQARTGGPASALAPATVHPTHAGAGWEPGCLGLSRWVGAGASLSGRHPLNFLSQPHRKLSRPWAQPCASTGPQDPLGTGPSRAGSAEIMGSKAKEPPSPAVQHFTFALTDLAGNRRFGFCRLGAGAQSCLCILSRLPWFEVFYKLLNNVGDLLAQNQVSEAQELLLNLLQQPLPGTQASGPLELGGGVKTSGTQGPQPPAPGDSRPLSCFVAPDSGRLPSIPENRNLTELVVAVTDENIVGLFAALLAERRVLLTASKLSTLTSCVFASCALLYPMRWEHVLIPTLPPHLLDYCCAPMPYLIGVHASLAEKVRDKALEDVVMMNVDSNILETPFNDVQALPPDVVSLLRLRLRKVALVPGEGVSRLFLKVQALLFGGYRDALVCSPGQPVTFSEEAFLAQKPGAPLQAFHRRAVHLQLFKQFIEGRLEKLNIGEGFSDLFEQEITCSGTCSGILRSYQLWADSLKKGGGALLHSVKAKTQPAVRNMYRSAKSGLKGMQSLLMYKDGESSLQRGGSLRAPSLTSRSERLQQRLPITQHFGKNRPLRPSRRFRLEEGPSKSPREGTPPLSPEKSGSPWAEEALDNSFLESGEELDLLSEILDSLSMGAKNAGSLRPSQSLDCCQSGDPDGCFSLLAVPGRPRWQPDDEKMPEPQPLSLPADLSSLQEPNQPSDTLNISENPNSHPPSDTNQEIISPSQPSATTADPGSQGDPKSSPVTQHHSPILHLSPLPKAAEELRAQDSPCSQLSTGSTQSSPPESQLLTPTKSEPDIAWTFQPTDASSDSGSPENPRAQASQVLPAQHSHLQPLEDLGCPRSPAAPSSNWQESQAKSRLRVAELKKCFEG